MNTIHFNVLYQHHPSTVSFSQKDVGKIITNLSPNKFHGRNNINMGTLRYVVRLFTDH